MTSKDPLYHGNFILPIIPGLKMEVHNLNQLPVYKKALDIFQVSRGIAYALSERRHVLEMEYSTLENERVAGTLVTTSLKLIPELAALQNATNKENIRKRANKIRRSARLLLAKCRSIEIQGRKEKEFLGLLRAEINQFDQLFGEWLLSKNPDKNHN